MLASFARLTKMCSEMWDPMCCRVEELKGSVSRESRALKVHVVRTASMVCQVCRVSGEGQGPKVARASKVCQAGMAMTALKETKEMQDYQVCPCHIRCEFL